MTAMYGIIMVTYVLASAGHQAIGNRYILESLIVKASYYAACMPL